MSIATEITRLQTSKADVKTQVNIDKDLINGGTVFIDDETVDDYDDKIAEMQEAYKKFIPIQTTSGTEIQLDNSSNDKALVNIGLDGNIEQFTTTGKNLFNKANITSLINGTLTNDVIVSASISSNYGGVSANIGDFSLSAGTYYLSAKIKVASGTSSVTMNTIAITGSPSVTISWVTRPNLSSNYQINVISFTLSETTSITNILFQLGSGNSNAVLNVTDIMISTSSNTDFEPYTGGIASPNPSYPSEVKTVTGENNINITSGNFLDSTTWTNDKYINSSNEIADANSWRYSDYVDISEGNFFYKNGVTGNLPKTILYDANKNPIQVLPVNFTLYNLSIYNAKYIRISTTIGVTPQLYQSQSYPINLASKNMFDISKMQAGYLGHNGAMVTDPAYLFNNEGYIRYIKVKPNTSYTFNINETTGTAEQWLGIAEYSAESESSFIQNAIRAIQAVPYTFTTSATTNYLCVSGRNMMNATKIQLEQGSIDTSYTPYFDPIELAKISTYKDFIRKGTGKNLFNSELEQGARSNSDGTTKISSTNYVRTKDTTIVSPSTKYTVSFGCKLTPRRRRYTRIYRGWDIYWKNSNTI